MNASRVVRILASQAPTLKLNRKLHVTTNNQALKDSIGTSPFRFAAFAANRAGPNFLDAHQQDFASLPQEAAV